MMQKFIRYLSLLLFLPISIITVFAEGGRDDYPSFTDAFNDIFYILSFLFGILLIISWYSYYLKNRNKLSLLPLSFPILFIILITGINIHHSVRKNVPVFLKAGVEGLSLELRTDSTYRLSSFGEFSAETYYGGFSISGDTLNLNGEDANYGIRKLLIKNGNKPNVYDKGELVQIKKTGDNNEHITVLRISIDKRK